MRTLRKVGSEKAITLVALVVTIIFSYDENVKQRFSLTIAKLSPIIFA